MNGIVAWLRRRREERVERGWLVQKAHRDAMRLLKRAARVTPVNPNVRCNAYIVSMMLTDALQGRPIAWVDIENQNVRFQLRHKERSLVVTVHACSTVVERTGSDWSYHQRPSSNANLEHPQPPGFPAFRRPLQYAVPIRRKAPLPRLREEGRSVRGQGTYSVGAAGSGGFGGSTVGRCATP